MGGNIKINRILLYWKILEEDSDWEENGIKLVKLSVFHEICHAADYEKARRLKKPYERQLDEIFKEDIKNREFGRKVEYPFTDKRISPSDRELLKFHILTEPKRIKKETQPRKKNSMEPGLEKENLREFNAEDRAALNLKDVLVKWIASETMYNLHNWELQREETAWKLTIDWIDRSIKAGDAAGLIFTTAEKAEIHKMRDEILTPYREDKDYWKNFGEKYKTAKELMDTYNNASDAEKKEIIQFPGGNYYKRRRNETKKKLK